MTSSPNYNKVFVPDCPVDQINNDLVFSLVQCPDFFPVKYQEGGLYDRCLFNFREHRKDLELIDNDIYQWVRLPITNQKYVFLVKPGKEVMEKTWYEDPHLGARYRTRLINIVRLHLLYYKSAVDDNIQAFSFGDSKHMIKPLKVLKHKWKRESFGKFRCKHCDIRGIRIFGTNDLISPIELLTCEENTIKDIIL